MRRTRTAAPSAPRSRDTPLSHRRLIDCLFAGPVLRWVARQCRRLAGAAFQLPQGGALSMRLRPDRPRCAALAPRVIAACTVLSCVRLCAPQDRLRRYLQASPPPWALSTPLLELRKYMCSLCTSAAAARSAGTMRVRLAGPVELHFFRCLCTRISGLCEAL